MHDEKKTIDGAATLFALVLALLIAVLGCEEEELFSNAENTAPDADQPPVITETNVVIVTNVVDVSTNGMSDGNSTNSFADGDGTNDPPGGPMP